MCNISNMNFSTVLMLVMAYMPYCISVDSAAAAAAATAVASSGDSKADAEANATVGNRQLSLCTDKCPKIVNTICGTDGVSYRNDCFRNCASLDNQAHGLPPIFVKSVGPCPNEVCSCNFKLDPVCANDGKTYQNKCLLECENRRRYALGLASLYIEYPGQCLDCICITVYDPVCASDGKTYGNICLFNCENKIRKLKGLPPLVLLHKGVCGCNCNKNYQPVCASDGKTYDNICLLNCENIKRAQQGQSLLFIQYYGQCICNCKYCPTNFQPVCGSDGITYWNPCWLNCRSNCKVASGGSPIKLIKYGYC